ncbi:aspartate carbamoyltransferase [Candidatus Gottesmanbacteria bacterium CG11_big_fil_rev_8_21_14_0_20_37_11]|uniref:Aspartate carbamoyltransferase n=1 Tax=Candidatus Gottesmanbacteria bacterium CG11_big_fil_rev_8_21_14_0_20_37_11 TaxID=1974575 RepID=A0A2H0NGD1_9BACT|nr:MAG: aspartate carbamoyltransferase [Candidatus Gottesmanbacteria bacterium CG11_big_fil_rev_8_21_14_0_20_37_11]
MKNSFYKKHLVDITHLNIEDIRILFKRASEIKKIVELKGGDNRLQGKIMATLFYEPSSRTFSSFVTAMQRLGGGIIPLFSMFNSSAVKGETLEDTARVFSSYADLLVVRHPELGSVRQMARYSSVPVVNAGDGIGDHPTQGLTDLYTIQQKFGDLNKLHVLFIGDLGHYRPVNSLSKLLSLYPQIRISFVSPKEVPIQDGLKKYLVSKKVKFIEANSFENILPNVDVLYVTRVKKEYMTESLYHKIKGSYVLTNIFANSMKNNSIIMHCLPRIDEISHEVDSNSRAVYFSQQVRNGMYVRMAILDMILRKN